MLAGVCQTKHVLIMKTLSIICLLVINSFWRNSELNQEWDGTQILLGILMFPQDYSLIWDSMLGSLQGQIIKIRIKDFKILRWNSYGDLCTIILERPNKFSLMLFISIILLLEDLILRLIQMMMVLLMTRLYQPTTWMTKCHSSGTILFTRLNII